jgi:ATP-binding cassette subfamily B protein
LFEITDLTKEDEHLGVDVKNKPGIIQFNDVSFNYPNCPDLFKNLTLTLKPATITAIVGASGVGKSTLVAMLQKIYRPVGGKILINAVNILDIKSLSLRNQIGIVPQKLELFNASVIENIAPGEEDPDLTRIMNISHQVGMLPMIEQLPLGFKTPLGEFGANLSGGQQQRIIIARALYRDPGVLVLDEPTSWLDPSSAQVVHDVMLSEKARGKTVVVITHRLTTARIADEILVLANGVVAESGRHDQLLAMNGEYARLWKTNEE